MKNMFDLTGKVAVVTGASSGIGREAAIAYAQYGADVAVLARRYDRLVELAAQIEKETGRKAIAIKCDVMQEAEVKAAIDTVLKEFGKIDILLNNAGVNIVGTLPALKSEDWHTVLTTNLTGDFYTCKYVIPGMIERKYGKIVNVSSVNAMVADKADWIQRPVYNSSKAGVVGLTTGLATNLAQHNITVNAIGPGLFPTEMTMPLFASEEFIAGYSAMVPASRPAKVDELNGAVIFLSSDASSYCTGQYICVDGGFTSI